MALPTAALPPGLPCCTVSAMDLPHAALPSGLPYCTHLSVSAMALPMVMAAVYPTGGQGAHDSHLFLGRAQKGGRLWHITMADLEEGGGGEGGGRINRVYQEEGWGCDGGREGGHIKYIAEELERWGGKAWKRGGGK